MGKFFVFLLLFIFVGSFAYAGQAKVQLYFFRGEGCQHCAAEEIFLEKMKLKYPEGSVLQVNDFEVYFSQENKALYDKMALAYGISASGVPATFIGEKVIVGFDNDAGIGKKIDDAIAYCVSSNCVDAGIKGGIKNQDGNFIIMDSNSASLDFSRLFFPAIAIGLAILAIAAAILFFVLRKSYAPKPQ